MVVDGPVAMSYPCNGLKDYPFTIQCINPSTDLVVYYLPTGELDGSEIRLMYGVNYVITGKGMVSPATTVITTVLAYKAPAKIIITRSTRAERVADYDDYAAGPMGQVDIDLDRLYMILQEKNSNDQVLVIPGTCTAITGYSLLLPTEGAVHNALNEHASLSPAHGAVSTVTPGTMMARDSNGRSKIADATVDDDIAAFGQLFRPKLKTLTISPYTLTKYDEIVSIITGNTAFSINLPEATNIGKQHTIVKTDNGTGVVQVIPFGSNIIGSAGNVSIYIGKQYESTTLLCISNGVWIVISGSFKPHQAVDPDGSQTIFGKYHRLPLTSASRKKDLLVPTAGNWSAEYQISGTLGIPNGAKAIKMRVSFNVTATAASTIFVANVAFSDNKASVPNLESSHSMARIISAAYAAGSYTGFNDEIDIQLNDAGQFYLYTINFQNCNPNQMAIYPIGYYMGN